MRYTAAHMPDHRMRLAREDCCLPGSRLWSDRLLAVALVLLIAGCSGDRAFSADLKSYCAAFARQDANNKTGISDENAAATDERWLGAYNKTFVACLENYNSQPSAPGEVSAKPRVERKLRIAKTSKPKARKRKQVGQAETSLISDAKRGINALPSAAKTARQARGASLCRRLEVNKAGTYRIINCSAATARKGR
jgi:hypothetical protein